MRWASLALAVMLAASSARAADDASALEAQAKALIAKPPSPEAVYRLKQDMSADRFKALRQDVAALTLHGTKIAAPAQGVVLGCPDLDPVAQRVGSLMQMAQISDDEAVWRTRITQTQDALAKREMLRKAADERTEQALLKSGAADDPWRAELARRVGRDQFGRSNWPNPGSPQNWAGGVDDAVANYLNAVTFIEGCAVDRDNTNWLKAQIARRGWPKISRDGATADQQAFLLVQHADHDPAWQAQVLAMLADLKASNETNPKTYAYLFDRVAMKHGGPQRYGTQGRCVGPGQWQPNDDEPGDLDARRASVGLMPEVDYMAVFKTTCLKKDY